MAGRLAGKVAIITGAGRGMGQAGAQLFAAEGATVAVAERRADAAEETVQSILSAGGNAFVVEVDVTDDESAAAMAKAVVARAGRIDVLWNNVGGIGWQQDGSRRPSNVNLGGGDILSIDPAYWDWQIRFNLTSVFLCCRHVIPVMIQQGAGSVISTSSGAANARSGNFHPYATAKGAIITLSRLMARKYSEHGVRSNVIVPGLIDSWDAAMLTDRAKSSVPMGRIGTVKEVAQAALFLASDDSSYINGDELYLDGGGHIGV